MLSGRSLTGRIVSYQTIVVDSPAEHVARITLNRPEKRNAISTPMRVELLDALRAHDHDPDVRVTVIRGAGTCFSAGYDLAGGPMMEGAPFYSAPGDGQWARQCNDTWFSIWDLAKPVIAQIHGYAIAGATELASACDLVYVADDAEISYPVVRVMSPPDWQYHTVLLGMRRAMELMLTGDPISGVEAAAIGFANRAFPADVARDVGARRGRKGGRGAQRPRPDQQAQRPSGLRRLGRPRRDPGRNRAAGAGRAHPDGGGQPTRTARPHEGPDREGR